MSPERALQAAVRERLSALGDPAIAAGQQAYMKSAMPFFGVKADAMRAALKEVFAEHPMATREAWQAATSALWREARFREERYAAIELTGARAYRAHQDAASLPMYEEMIVTGAWWDLVDVIAIHRVGPIVLGAPALKATMLKWAVDPDLWRRRTAIICQVAAKERTDLEVLHRVIEANLADKDFFIRKAIGWALRSYARIDAGEVARFVAEKGARMSGLSRREALKNLGGEAGAGAEAVARTNTRGRPPRRARRGG